MIKRLALLTVVVVVSTLLSGCPLVDPQKIDSQILAGLQQYFPNAVLFKFDDRVLWLQTGVDGISSKFAAETFQSFSQKPEFGDLRKGMFYAGYRFMMVTLQKWTIVYDWQSDRVYTPMDGDQMDVWCLTNLGYGLTQLANDQVITVYH